MKQQQQQQQQQQQEQQQQQQRLWIQEVCLNGVDRIKGHMKNNSFIDRTLLSSTSTLGKKLHNCWNYF